VNGVTSETAQMKLSFQRRFKSARDQNVATARERLAPEHTAAVAESRRTDFGVDRVHTILTIVFHLNTTASTNAKY